MSDEPIHPVRRDTTDVGKLDNVRLDAEQPGLDDTSAAVDVDTLPSVDDD
jgi:hypothetical protein